MQERQLQSLGQEDPLEKEMATHSSYFCLENSMDRKAWQATVLGSQELDTTQRLNHHQQLHREKQAAQPQVSLSLECEHCGQSIRGPSAPAIFLAPAFLSSGKSPGFLWEPPLPHALGRACVRDESSRLVIPWPPALRG